MKIVFRMNQGYAQVYKIDFESKIYICSVETLHSAQFNNNIISVLHFVMICNLNSRFCWWLSRNERRVIHIILIFPLKDEIDILCIWFQFIDYHSIPMLCRFRIINIFQISYFKILQISTWNYMERWIVVDLYKRSIGRKLFILIDHFLRNSMLNPHMLFTRAWVGEYLMTNMTSDLLSRFMYFHNMSLCTS